MKWCGATPQLTGTHERAGRAMIVAIHQPQYLPWLGYFAKMHQADVFVLLDTVQFKKHEWQNRNRIKTAQGWQWLTVPVMQQFPQRLAEVQINPGVRWPHKHCQALRSNYSRAPYFQDYRSEFEDMLGRPWERLVDLNTCVITALRDALHITTPLLLASELPDDADPTGRLVSICQALGGTTYLSAPRAHGVRLRGHGSGPTFSLDVFQ